MRIKSSTHSHSKSSDGLIAILISLAGFGLYYALNLVLSRNLSAEVYGDYYIVIQVLTLCGTLGAFGINTAIVKFLPQMIEQRSQLGFFIWWFNKIVLFATGGLTILGAVVAAICLLLVKLGITSFNNYHPIVFSFWLIPLFVYSLITNTLLQGADKVNLAMFLSNIILVIIEIIVILGAVIFVKKMNIYLILFLVGIAQMLVIFIQMVIARSKLGFRISKNSSAQTTKHWLKYAEQMLINNVLLYTGNAIVAILFEIIGRSEAEVGVFAAINTICSLIYTVSLGVNTLLSPKLSRYANDPQNLQAVVNKANLIRLIFTLPIIVGLVYFAKPILHMFNPDFTAYVSTLNITTISAFIGVQLSICAYLLMYAGVEKLEIVANVIYLGLSIILCIVLIPKYQLVGAIWAQAIGVVVSYLFEYFAVRFTSSIRSFFFV